MKHFLTFIALVLTALVSAQTVNPNALDGTLIFKVKAEYSPEFVSRIPENQQLKSTLANAGVKRIYQSFKGLSENLDHYVRVDFANLQQTELLIKNLSLLPFVERVESYPLLKVDHVPNDIKPQQWHLPVVHAPQAWLLQLGAPQITVAVSDNAILTSHPDLRGVIYENPGEIDGNGKDDDGNGYVDDMHGYDIADSDGDPQPPSDNFDDGELDFGWSHGTKTSGVIGAHTNNTVGIAALGYGIKILPVKATWNSTSSIYITHGYESIVYAALMGADVLNMSWGGVGYYNFSAEIVKEAFSSGMVLIASAGNDDNAVPHYPAAFEVVIGVGATNVHDQKASFSCYGPWVDVMAPGDLLWTTSHSSDLVADMVYGYDFFSGTSAAAPVVSGIAGLIKSFDLTMTAVQLVEYITEGCDNIDAKNPSYAGQMGAGRVNAERSLVLAGASLLGITSSLNDQQYSFVQRGGQLFIEFNGYQEGTLILSDLQGRTVFEGSCRQSPVAVEINATGVFIARVIVQDGSVFATKLYLQ